MTTVSLMPDAKRIYVNPLLKEEYLSKYRKEYFQEQGSSVSEVENAVVLPLKKNFNEKGNSFFQGGVVDAEGNFFDACAHIHSLENEIGSLKTSYDFKEKDVISDDGTVIYGGILFDHLGHFLTESTTRLWYAIEHAEQKYPIVFLKEMTRPFGPQILQFFDLLGLSGRVLCLDRPTRFKKVIVPSVSSIFAASYNDKFMSPFRTAAAAVKAETYEKIYLSRRKFKTGIKIFGEDKLEKAFKTNGYKIIYPEKLTLKKQIAYIKGAKEIASVMGTATHLSLFANKNTKNIVLERSEVIVYEQILINQAVGLDWYSVSASQNYLPVGHEFSPLLIGITDHVAEFFKNNGFAFDQKDINKIPDKAIRQFNRSWFSRYSANKYNRQIVGLDPIYADRIKSCCQTAFLSFRQRLFMKRTDGIFRIYTIFGFSFKVRRKVK